MLSRHKMKAVCSISKTEYVIRRTTNETYVTNSALKCRSNCALNVLKCRSKCMLKCRSTCRACRHNFFLR